MSRKPRSPEVGKSESPEDEQKAERPKRKARKKSEVGSPKSEEENNSEIGTRQSEIQIKSETAQPSLTPVKN